MGAPFLILALDGAHGTHWRGGWVGPEPVWCSRKEKNLALPVKTIPVTGREGHRGVRARSSHMF
jgi:hypothetical protein